MSRLIGIGTSCPSTSRQHAVLVGPPLGEAATGSRRSPRELVWKMCGPYWWISTPALVVVVVGVAADVRAPVDQQHPLAAHGCQPLGQHAAGEAGADDQLIVTCSVAAARLRSRTPACRRGVAAARRRCVDQRVACGPGLVPGQLGEMTIDLRAARRASAARARQRSHGRDEALRRRRRSRPGRLSP